MLDTVNVKKIEEKNKQFLIEKTIHSVEFTDLYATNPEKKKKQKFYQRWKTIIGF